MTLRRDQWFVLEVLAAQGSIWVSNVRPPQARSSPGTIAQVLAEHGLCELAPDDILDTLVADGARPDWAARITALGRTALTYRALQQNPTPQPDPELDPLEIDLCGSAMDVLRAALVAAEAGTLPGVDDARLRAALAGARSVPGSLRHTMTPAPEELLAVLSVLHLESLVRDASGYHHLLRQLPGDLATWRALTTVPAQIGC
ncbi:hypothetical protein [Kitasatospora sp. NPDC008115]|uniref:hypothetical protein n=1 Tax=Kitasatospora sp. NPDC008115 TaxID=3364022 RepID=UPI0036EF3F9D